jgi:hypothetical protein
MSLLLNFITGGTQLLSLFQIWISSTNTLIFPKSPALLELYINKSRHILAIGHRHYTSILNE